MSDLWRQRAAPDECAKARRRRPTQLFERSGRRSMPRIAQSVVFIVWRHLRVCSGRGLILLLIIIVLIIIIPIRRLIISLRRMITILR